MSSASLPIRVRPSRSLATGRGFDAGSAREVLKHANLTRDEDGWKLVVCDSYRLAVLPLTVDDDDGPELTEGLISAEALRAIERHGGRFRAHEHVELLDNFGRPVGQMFARPVMPDPPFPNHNALIPDSSLHPFADAVRVKLDARLLFGLAQALGRDQVTLTIPATGPVGVDADTDAGGLGLIMPIRVPS